jgi:phosphohistidine phosphatase
MRRLLLLRHAKAVAHSFDDDFNRELTERGQEDARRIGEWIAREALAPDLCVYSGAARTRETCEIVAGALPRPVETIEENALYDASNSLILGLLRALPDSARAALVVGHNPGMGEVASLLSGDGPASERLRLAARFPTAALAVIVFGGPDWASLAPRAGRLEWFVTPKDI